MEMNSYYTEWCDAVSQDLLQIAALHDREADEELITALREINFPYNLGFSVSAMSGPKTDQLLSPQRFVEKALEELPEKLDQHTLDWLAVDYADIYLNHSINASPYESVWLDEDHLIQQEPMFKIRNCYRRYGLGASDWRVRSDDHLVLQLQFIAMLLDSDSTFAEDIPLDKRLKDATHFLDEHLLLWLPDFTYRVVQRSNTDFYASIAHMTHVYIDQLRDALEQITHMTRPSPQEIEAKLKVNQPVMEQPITFMPGVAESW